MFPPASSVRVFVATEAVDFRKAHDGLCAIVRDHLRGDPFSGDVYVFFNKSRTRIKLIYWERNGFWLQYKRLERGRFESLPSPDRARSLRIEPAQLSMLLGGIELKNCKMWKHFARTARPRMRTTWGAERDGTSGRSARVGERSSQAG